MLAEVWGTGQVLLDMLWFFLFVIEIWLMITIFIDIFRRHDMRGWLKALWVLLVLVVPLLGIVLYLIVYGNEMKVHAQQAMADNAQAARVYFGDTPGSSDVSDLVRLAELRDRGVINEEEFERIKARIVGSERSGAGSS